LGATVPNSLRTVKIKDRANAFLSVIPTPRVEVPIEVEVFVTCHTGIPLFTVTEEMLHLLQRRGAVDDVKSLLQAFHLLIKFKWFLDAVIRQVRLGLT
jgi:hypothetical protein